jgi:DNA-binding XRE family transcriptional regulator
MPAGKSLLPSDVDRTSPPAVIASSSWSTTEGRHEKSKAKNKVSQDPPGPVDQYPGARMRESRLAINMSQAGLGDKLGVTFQQIQKYENGRNRVSAARLFEICEALGVSLASMFERKLKA